MLVSSEKTMADKWFMVELERFERDYEGKPKRLPCFFSIDDKTLYYVDTKKQIVAVPMGDLLTKDMATKIIDTESAHAALFDHISNSRILRYVVSSHTNLESHMVRLINEEKTEKIKANQEKVEQNELSAFDA